MGSDARGRRHISPAWLKAGVEAGDSLRGRKLVVQMVETTQPDGSPSFVEELDAFAMTGKSGFALPPIMIYGEDVTHVISEVGVANLLLCRGPEDRQAALRAIAGATPFGRKASLEDTAVARERGVVMLPEDLGIAPDQATRALLAAKSIDELVEVSGGLYNPPAQFRRRASST